MLTHQNHISQVPSLATSRQRPDADADAKALLHRCARSPTRDHFPPNHCTQSTAYPMRRTRSAVAHRRQATRDVLHPSNPIARGERCHSHRPTKRSAKVHLVNTKDAALRRQGIASHARIASVAEKEPIHSNVSSTTRPMEVDWGSTIRTLDARRAGYRNGGRDLARLVLA